MIKLLFATVALSLFTSTYGELAYEAPYPVVRLPRAALFGLFGHNSPVAVPAPAHPAPSNFGGAYPQTNHPQPNYPQTNYPHYPTYPTYQHNGGSPTAVPAPAYPHGGASAAAYAGGPGPYRPVALFGQPPHYFLY